jgi:hypothetical protein
LAYVLLLILTIASSFQLPASASCLLPPAS